MQHDRVEIYLDANNHFRWRRIAPNGRIISDSGEGYEELHAIHLAVLRNFGRPWTLDLSVNATDAPDAVKQELFAHGAVAGQDGIKDEQSW